MRTFGPGEGENVDVRTMKTTTIGAMSMKKAAHGEESSATARTRTTTTTGPGEEAATTARMRTATTIGPDEEAAMTARTMTIDAGSSGALGTSLPELRETRASSDYSTSGYCNLRSGSSSRAYRASFAPR